MQHPLNLVRSVVQKTKNRFTKRWFWVVIVIVAIAVGSSGSSESSTSTDSGNSTNTATTDKNTVEKKAKLEIVDGVEGIIVEQDMFSLYFSGVIQNNTNKKYTY